MCASEPVPRDPCVCEMKCCGGIRPSWLALLRLHRCRSFLKAAWLSRWHDVEGWAAGVAGAQTTLRRSHRMAGEACRVDAGRTGRCPALHCRSWSVPSRPSCVATRIRGCEATSDVTRMSWWCRCRLKTPSSACAGMTTRWTSWSSASDASLGSMRTCFTPRRHTRVRGPSLALITHRRSFALGFPPQLIRASRPSTVKKSCRMSKTGLKLEIDSVCFVWLASYQLSVPQLAACNYEDQGKGGLDSVEVLPPYVTVWTSYWWRYRISRHVLRGRSQRVCRHRSCGCPRNIPLLRMCVHDHAAALGARACCPSDCPNCSRVPYDHDGVHWRCRCRRSCRGAHDPG